MTDKILDVTSHETYNAIWAEIDGEVYGIADNFDPNTLMDSEGLPFKRVDEFTEELAGKIRKLNISLESASIHIANNALENCTSIDQVVELMASNKTDATPELIAAAYAINGAQEAGYGVGDAEIEAQLDALVEAGAVFQYANAMQIVKKS